MSRHFLPGEHGDFRGQPCIWCDEPILLADDGFLVPHLGALHEPVTQRPYHAACLVRSFVGGLNHQRGACACCNGDQPPDPPWLTKHQAAIVAAQEHTNRRLASK